MFSAKIYPYLFNFLEHKKKDNISMMLALKTLMYINVYITV